MEKVVYLVAYPNGDSFETELVEEARHAKDEGAAVLEIRTDDRLVAGGKVRVEMRITVVW